MDFIEAEGKTYEEAVRKAAAGLNAEEKDLDIEVTEVDTKGILGILGSKKIRITARLRAPVPEEAAAEPSPEEYAKRFLTEIAAMYDVSLRVSTESRNDRILFCLESSDPAALTGKDGEVLEALQHLVKLAVTKRYGQSMKLLLDVDGFREQHKQHLVAMAKKLADTARREGKPQMTKPLNPYERRIVHTLFKNSDRVTTHSEGEGHLKKVVISPSRQERSAGGRGRRI
jgi:spoIIIJ-associated protein